eukprot:1037494-Pleurochrysis_carterae.AAC.1
MPDIEKLLCAATTSSAFLFAYVRFPRSARAGALTIFLKNPGAYASVSAFAPICNPTKYARPNQRTLEL